MTRRELLRLGRDKRNKKGVRIRALGTLLDFTESVEPESESLPLIGFKGP